jgi:hypothetical protein
MNGATMAKRKKTALEALGAFEREQQKRATEQAELRRAAALELGFAVLEAGGARLSIEALRTAVRTAIASLPNTAGAGSKKEAGRG